MRGWWGRARCWRRWDRLGDLAFSQRTLRRAVAPDGGCGGPRGSGQLRPAMESRRGESSQTHRRLEIAAYSVALAAERKTQRRSRVGWREQIQRLVCCPEKSVGNFNAG